MPINQLKIKIRNLLRQAKSLENVSPEILTLTKKELLEISELGIEIKTGIFHELEPEAIDIAKEYAEMYIKRYSKNRNLSSLEKQNQFRMGLTQKAFELLLQQCQIPYIPNDPTIDWRPKESVNQETAFLYDFYIPFIGKIDIKSNMLGTPFVNVNCSDFEKERPDFIVAYMISDIECPKWLKLLGYMSAETIQSYSTKLKDGDKEYRRYWQIPTEDFEKSNGVAFVCKLMTARYRLKSADSHYPING